ncbi:MAG: hypothetical protein B7Y40_06020 [Gammaproteobacteria bacterium 28-57-27]|nr:MAG: hypothetical protein B7Y40_06020 [Gammaproteobacteria bacterium 28-57-27]
MLEWLDTLKPPEAQHAPTPEAMPAQASTGLLAHVRRMALFYEYSEQETDQAIESARAAPDTWRVIVATSMKRWGWTLQGNERHPWITPS